MCPVIPNQGFENELMTETNATKIVSTALIVFHSSGACEHLWTVFQGGMAPWKMCTKSEGLLPMPGRIDGYWWNLGMSSFRLTGAKKTFGCEIATLWNQRRVKSELCEGWSKMPIWCQVFVKATWSFSQMAITTHLMARLVLLQQPPSPVHLAYEETVTVIGMWSDFVGMLATIPPTTGLVSWNIEHHESVNCMWTNTIVRP